MALSYYNVEKAAQVLGLSPDEVRKMRERNELHGYRDGTNWKFKAEDVDRLAAARASASASGDEVLMDDGPGFAPAPGSSGSVVGGGSSGLGSDVAFAAMGSGVSARPPASHGPESDLKLVDDEILDSRPMMAPAKTDSVLGGEDVLSGGGSGTDIQDSGIALLDPHDSGLALDEIGATGDDEGLQLGEDDLLATKDDDFLLTPMASDQDEDSESGSQVIALDSEPIAEDAATLIGTPSKANLVAMLDEDLSPMGAGALAVAPAMGAPGMGGPALTPGMAATMDFGVAAGQAEMVAPMEALPQQPYSVVDVLLLTLCLVVLAFGAAMLYDLIRNMWSWGTPYQLNSSLMDSLVKMLEGK